MHGRRPQRAPQMCRLAFESCAAWCTCRTPFPVVRAVETQSANVRSTAAPWAARLCIPARHGARIRARRSRRAQIRLLCDEEWTSEPGKLRTRLCTARAAAGSPAPRADGCRSRTGQSANMLGALLLALLLGQAHARNRADSFTAPQQGRSALPEPLPEERITDGTLGRARGPPCLCRRRRCRLPPPPAALRPACAPPPRPRPQTAPSSSGSGTASPTGPRSRRRAATAAGRSAWRAAAPAARRSAPGAASCAAQTAAPWPSCEWPRVARRLLRGGPARSRGRLLRRRQTLPPPPARPPAAATCRARTSAAPPSCGAASTRGWPGWTTCGCWTWGTTSWAGGCRRCGASTAPG